MRHDTQLFNLAFIDNLYEDYLEDPMQVGEKWRAYFDSLKETEVNEDTSHRPIQARFLAHAKQSGKPSAACQTPEQIKNQNAVLRLINYHRYRGHQAADLDPLNLRQRLPLQDLHLATHGLTPADMDTVFNTGSLFTFPKRKAKLKEIYRALRNVYCHHIGIEYMHITDTPRKRWIQKRVETDLAGQRTDHYLTTAQRLEILDRLAAAEGIEYYLDRHYPGQKRFSLEGGESLIPLLDTALQRAGKYGVQESVIGMAHRGRLNVLVNIMGQNPNDLFTEFEGGNPHPNAEITGDVKYHKGYSSDIVTNQGDPMHLVLAFNPSHLEIINPVVEGSVRARQERLGDAEHQKVLPVLIHGDAAFSGQGVVMETLNLSDTHGYNTGGTLHIIINNQIGFTTSDPCDARSTYYCTDIAKMVEAPIFHVNGDDPDAVVYATRLALDFRMTFHQDVVIDLICYRRHGHNEADEPGATQPFMYQAIKKHPSVHQIYAEQLIAAGVITSAEAESIAYRYRADLSARDKMIQHTVTASPHRTEWKDFVDKHWTLPAQTHLNPERLQTLGKALLEIPKGFQLHRVVKKIMQARADMLTGERYLDWGMAEALAYASLITEGYGVRLSGQDSERGTFAHRHAVLHDINNGLTYTPLHHVAPDQKPFRVYNSLLSEEAVLGFELGYSSSEPNILTLWEAQFGDFANGAQVVIDQFISSSEAKWQRLCGLVMLLPHGYDGQGPEHSSARIERYLQLCAQDNIQVCMPSTPAQFFHLLRRQMLRPYRKPLIVFTPKSLLRDQRSASPLAAFTEHDYQLLVDDRYVKDPKTVHKVLLCSGQIYYKLRETQQQREQEQNVAIIRIEQFYPFPEEAIEQMIKRYQHVQRWYWVQNEPRNQGAWQFIAIKMQYLLMQIDCRLNYIGRPLAASPAAGSLRLHQQQLETLLDEAFEG